MSVAALRQTALSPVCHHKADRMSLCPGCLDESYHLQPWIWEVVNDLSSRSAFSRDAAGPTCEINHARAGSYQLRIAQDQKTIRTVHHLMRNAFTGNEVESLDDFTSGIQGVRLHGDEHHTHYRVFVAERDSQIYAMYAGSLVRLQTPEPESVFVGAYAFTRTQVRGKGVARELFISAMQQAAMDATATGTTMRAIVGDCTSSSEVAWNNMGRYRIYKRLPNGTLYELPFYQPAQKFKPDGRPSEEAGEVPEHFMMRILQGPLTTDMVLNSARAAYCWTGRLPRAFFENDVAYRRYQAYFEGLLQKLQVFLSNEGELVFFSQEQRAALRSEGCAIVDHDGTDDYRWE